MAKILISPLGVGGQFQNQHQREYRKTCYRIDEVDYPQSSFVASVLYQNLQLDGIIFIGTVKSMWEEVYRFFCEANNQPFNEDYWFTLAETIDSLNANSSINALNLDPLNQVLGEHSTSIAIITYVCECEGEDIRQEEGRRKALEIIHSPQEQHRKLPQLYFQINPIRNRIAHASLSEVRGSGNFQIAINNALGYYQEAKRIFRTNTLG